MDDLISRQAVLDLINTQPSEETSNGLLYQSVKQLPSAQPEYDNSMCYDCPDYDHENQVCPKFCKIIRGALSQRKEGRWIRKSNWMWTCSCCGKDNAYAYTADDAFEPTVLQDFFCPNCGAKMGGHPDEE